MAKNIITATEVRNNFFNLINMVIATGNPIYIKKGKEVKVKLELVKEELAATSSATLSTQSFQNPDDILQNLSTNQNPVDSNLTQNSGLQIYKDALLSGILCLHAPNH